MTYCVMWDVKPVLTRLEEFGYPVHGIMIDLRSERVQ